jgi:DNA-binding transcriptional LysR family regulator
MDVRQLKYFVAIAEELHFGRAAKRLCITQPPLSFNIKRLEESLGFELLRRNTRDVALTTAGKALYAEATKILAQMESARRLAERAAQGKLGHVRIGALGSALLTSLPEKIRSFQSPRPDVSIEINELTSVEQYEALRQEQIDIGIVHFRPLPAGVSSALAYSERFMCALHHSHRFAARKKVNLSQLAGDEFILFPRHSAPAYHERIVALCVEAGFVPRVRHQVRNMLSVTSLVSQNLGVAIIPAVISRVPMPDVVYRHLRDPGAISELHCIWRTQETSPLVLGMVAALS